MCRKATVLKAERVITCYPFCKFWEKDIFSMSTFWIFFWPRSISLLPSTISESLTLIGPGMCEIIEDHIHPAVCILGYWKPRSLASLARLWLADRPVRFNIRKRLIYQVWMMPSLCGRSGRGFVARVGDSSVAGDPCGTIDRRPMGRHLQITHCRYYAGCMYVEGSYWAPQKLFDKRFHLGSRQNPFEKIQDGKDTFIELRKVLRPQSTFVWFRSFLMKVRRGA